VRRISAPVTWNEFDSSKRI